MAFAAAAVTPEKRRPRNAETPWPWNIFSLDSENLMRVRRLLRVQLKKPLTNLRRRGRVILREQDFILQPEAEDKRLE